MPLNCQHHVQWVRPVEGGLHQCILCHRVVGRTEVYPKLEDLPEDFRRRWDAHEASRSAPAAEPSASAAPAKPAAAPAKAPVPHGGSAAAAAGAQPDGGAPA